MGFSEERTKRWRLLNAVAIQVWQRTLKERLASMGAFNYEREEMEVLQLLQDKELKEIWRFSSEYVHRRKTVKLRNIFMRAKKEIETHGTIEPVWKVYLIEIINQERRRRGTWWIRVKKR